MSRKVNPGKKRSAGAVDDESNCKKPVEIRIVTSKVLKAGGEYKDKLKDAWINKKEYSDNEMKLSPEPFRHGECKIFVENENFLEEFVEHFSSFEFHEKASDLFQFRQSDDLKSYVNPYVYKIMEYLTNKVLPWMKIITDLPLNGDIDLFLSDYRKNDFLLCHDDELDSRRIAFILYLSKSWKTEFGGNLDLLSRTEDQRHPNKVEKSIVPEFNKFTFFEVSEASFHQVSQVTEEGVRRLALSGWFYGDPLPRTKINYPKDEGYAYLNHLVSIPNVLKDFCMESYLDVKVQRGINEQLSEESQVIIPGFFQDETYKNICADIVDQDVTNSTFVHVGPPNVANYQETCIGPPIFDKSSAFCSSNSQNMNGLHRLFHSKEFLEFLEKVTELPFSSSTLLKTTSSLRKYSKGSYYLLRSGGAKQTGDVEEKKLEEQDDEDEQDPNLVDVVYFVASKWDDNWGGLTIYSSEDGEQLITIPPTGNCLAIVVRNSTVNSYMNYINTDAGDEVFFAYSMTYALDGNL